MSKLEEIAGCVILKDDKILLVKEKNQDYFKLPSGKIESGEYPYQTAIRETKEETGLIVRLSEKLGIFPFDFKNRKFRLHMYLADIISGDLSPRNNPDETIKLVKWLPIEYLNQDNSLQFDRIIYGTLLNKGLINGKHTRVH